MPDRAPYQGRQGGREGGRKEERKEERKKERPTRRGTDRACSLVLALRRRRSTASTVRLSPRPSAPPHRFIPSHPPLPTHPHPIPSHPQSQTPIRAPTPSTHWPASAPPRTACSPAPQPHPAHPSVLCSCARPQPRQPTILLDCGRPTAIAGNAGAPGVGDEAHQGMPGGAGV